MIERDQFIIGAPEFDEGYEDERITFEATEFQLSDFQFIRAKPLNRPPQLSSTGHADCRCAPPPASAR